jgi:pimeloyl-ACP methyl ester carboxylesterase
MMNSLRSKVTVTMALALSAALLAVSPAGAHPGPRPAKKPTVVLVHGAFADSSGFSGIVERLQAAGYPVVAAANPLRSLSSDAASIRALLDTIDGPIILVAHSYGGNVISAAAAGDNNVKALVYFAGYIPETGETTAELTDKFPGSLVGSSLKQVPLPDGGIDLYIDPAKYPHAFAGGVPLKQAAALAVSQRPATAAALNEPSTGVQAWHTIPSYVLISGSDLIIPPALQRFMAERAHAKVEVIEGASHLGVFLSHPDTATALIEKAARQTVK